MSDIGSEPLQMASARRAKAEREVTGDETTKPMLASGWFAALEVTLPLGSDAHPMLSRAIEDAIPNHGVLMYAEGRYLRGVIDLWSDNLDDDRELADGLSRLKAGPLAHAALSVTVHHDSMGVTPPGPPDLRVVQDH